MLLSLFKEFPIKTIRYCFIIFCLLTYNINAQIGINSFLYPSDTLNKARFLSCSIGTTMAFTGVSVGLYNTWYKKFELTKFHTFNDIKEWKGMDKTGHFITTYNHARIAYQGARWTGLSKKKALWSSVGVGLVLQSSIEIMDGFSEKWGFSWSDTGFNLLGAVFFASQIHYWDEIKLKLKLSSPFRNYSDMIVQSASGNFSTRISTRANELFGYSYPERFLKDYNALTLWLSFSPELIIKKNTKIPKWLNLSIGYGADNLFGGFDNNWMEENGESYSLPPSQFPRFQQFYLSFDIDLTKIKMNSLILKTIFKTFNFVKIPSPTLEFNTRGQVKFHPFMW